MRQVHWDDESAAASVMRSLLGGRTQTRDPGGGAAQLHDFDLYLENGCSIAVEVTRHSAPGYLAQRGAVDKLDWSIPGLRSDWHVGMIESYQVKRLRSALGPLLSALEAAGVQSCILREPIDPGPGAETRQALFDLGVRIAYALELASPGVHGTVDVGESARVGSVGFSDLAHVASLHANKQDNSAKLSSGAALERDERHLFIWVESSAHQVTAAMAMGPVGDAPAPVLPEAVEKVWMASAFTRSTVWSYSRSGGWTNNGKIDLASPNDEQV